MKASELRLGNLFLFQVNSNDSEFELMEGLVTSIKLSDYNFIVNELYHEEDIKPIPLTEEWLFKLGFTRNSNQSQFKMIFSDKAFFITEDFNFNYNTTYLVTLKHVHQLQNLYFALTGEELTIK